RRTGRIRQTAAESSRVRLLQDRSLSKGKEIDRRRQRLQLGRQIQLHYGLERPSADRRRARAHRRILQATSRALLVVPPACTIRISNCSTASRKVIGGFRRCAKSPTLLRRGNFSNPT